MDCKDKNGKWFESRVDGFRNNQVKIHFFNYHPKHDEWISSTSSKIAEIGSHTKAYGIGKTKRQKQKIENYKMNGNKKCIKQS